jgi:hypothetical protein
MSHDYDPNWDYPVVELSSLDEISEADAAGILAAIELAKASLAPAMGFEQGFDVFWVEPMGLTSFKQLDTAVAVYCSGTNSRPVVGFDLTQLKCCCQEDELSLVEQFEISLAHELAHAYQESIGQGWESHHDEDSCSAFDEDEAEEFGRIWARKKQISLHLLLEVS